MSFLHTEAPEEGAGSLYRWTEAAPEKNRSGVQIGARGRNRTGTLCSEGFSYHFDFRRQRPGCSWSGARLHHRLSALGARRLLSTPSRMRIRAWLGVGSDTEASRAFADFDGLHFGRFPPKAQIVQVPCVYLFHHSGSTWCAGTHSSCCRLLLAPDHH